MHATSVITAVPAAPSAVGTALIEAHDLTRVWGKGSAAQIGVGGVDLTIHRGEVVAVIGPSGSGKSTLGALLAGIDRPTSGSLVVDGTRIDRMKTDQLAAWRGRHVGIVFQDFHLLPTLTAAENVELAIELSGAGAGRRLRRSAARAALDRVGLGGHARKLPAQMSGGEQQRVGIARAMVTQPPLIVADEPTGALDQANGHAVFELLTGAAKSGTTVVFITHDLTLAGAADRTISMIDGAVASNVTKAGV
ncbi:MAG: ABC transporter ATP-binding protein [Ilumatobacteraceae bacterium]|nr:ABC transporter ATP-binding protein [Ilumatobacteraceae bacterium]